MIVEAVAAVDDHLQVQSAAVARIVDGVLVKAAREDALLFVAVVVVAL